MAKDTAAWFGASLQERRRLQTVLWYDDGLAFLPVPDLTNGIHLLCPTRLKNLLLQPSHKLLVLETPLTVE
jgi:hypothetical protein